MFTVWKQPLFYVRSMEAAPFLMLAVCKQSPPYMGTWIDGKVWRQARRSMQAVPPVCWQYASSPLHIWAHCWWQGVTQARALLCDVKFVICFLVWCSRSDSWPIQRRWNELEEWSSGLGLANWSLGALEFHKYGVEEEPHSFVQCCIYIKRCHQVFHVHRGAPLTTYLSTYLGISKNRYWETHRV